MPQTAHFSPALFRFLRELAENNNREWFQRNKHRYEGDVREPVLAFIASFAKPLGKISPHFVADPRTVGGSMLRVYRDVRFSKDKRPYKTNAAAQFRHNRGKDVHAPGFYLHLEPGSIFLGAGIWRPDSKALGLIRNAIVENPTAWKRAAASKRFREDFRLEGDSLKRPPRGVDPDHPLIEDLKRKDFIAVTSFNQKQACSSSFLNDVTVQCRSATPLVRFLTQSLKLDF